MLYVYINYIPLSMSLFLSLSRSLSLSIYIYKNVYICVYIYIKRDVYTGVLSLSLSLYIYICTQVATNSDTVVSCYGIFDGVKFVICIVFVLVEVTSRPNCYSRFLLFSGTPWQCFVTIVLGPWSCCDGVLLHMSAWSGSGFPSNTCIYIYIYMCYVYIYVYEYGKLLRIVSGLSH